MEVFCSDSHRDAPKSGCRTLRCASKKKEETGRLQAARMGRGRQRGQDVRSGRCCCLPSQRFAAPARATGRDGDGDRSVPRHSSPHARACGAVRLACRRIQFAGTRADGRPRAVARDDKTDQGHHFVRRRSCALPSQSRTRAFIGKRTRRKG